MCDLQAQVTALLLQGAYQQVVALLQAQIDVEPDDIYHYWQLGLAYLLMGEELEAQGIWLAALATLDEQTQESSVLDLVEYLEAIATQFSVLASDRLEPIDRQILELDPNRESACLRLMEVLANQQRWEEAIACGAHLLTLRPDDIGIYNNLGILWEYQGTIEKAIACYQRILELDPHHASACYHLGRCHQQQNESLAEKYYQTSLSLDPAQVAAYYDLGALYEHQGQLEQAIACYQGLLSKHPEESKAYHYLGYCLQKVGCFEEARTAFDRSIELNPDDPDAYFNRSSLLLLLGKFEQGWQDFEFRRLMEGYPVPHFPFPLWDGASLNGKRILLVAEYGFGDTLQFIRYALLVAQQGGRVIVQAPDALIPLLQSIEGIDEVVSHSSQPPFCEIYVPLMSLPYLFRTELETIPHSSPYLFAPTDRAVSLQKTKSSNKINVGIAWAGNPQYRSDRTRSCHLRTLLPILQVPGVEFYSLQKGESAAQLLELPDPDSIQDLGSQFKDFGDTAAVIAQLDLVITTDTAIAHLAGALGKPTWVLLSFVPDWRWLLDREDSPWYPTMRLFRQTQPGDWEGVMGRVAEALYARLI